MGVKMTPLFSKIFVIFLLIGYTTNVLGFARLNREINLEDELSMKFKHLREDSTHDVEKADEEQKEQCKDPMKCNTCPGESVCVPTIKCPALVRPGAKITTCHLTEKRQGICCSTGQNHTTQEDMKARTSMDINEKELETIKSKTKAKLHNLQEKEKEIMENRKHSTIVSKGQPTFGHFQSVRTADPEKTLDVHNNALHQLFMMKAIKERESISDEMISLGLGHVKINDMCPPQPKCESFHNKFRSLDGTCNNILHPSWGAVRTATERLLPPKYSDGIWSPRKSVTGGVLKSARHASRNLLPDKNRPHSLSTLLITQFGQFVSHDITSSVTLTYPNGSAISCCTADGKVLPSELMHFGCLPIEINNDDFYSQFKQSCMNFVRTQLAPNHDCSLGYAKQMNGVTHFADLSHVYGSDSEVLGNLREWFGGRMRMFNDFGRDLLPLSDDKNDCLTMEMGSACFKSGDGHVNQMVALVAMHMIFTREHNRIAGILSSLNPHWSDQLVFLEARKIVIAEYQHVIYNEWLPLVIGEQTMHEFDLKPKYGAEYSFSYDPSVNPSLTAEFSVAAFRFGHSTVDGHLKIRTFTGDDEVIALSELMFQPGRLRVKQFYDRVLKALTAQPMQETDASITKMLTKYMFRGGQPFGLDLASLNIQRGRDHGLRGYNDYRKLVGLFKLQSIEDFGPKVAEHLSEVYDHVDDIDLWIGGLIEAPTGGALVGYTFKEIIADQFSRFKHGDRYFYEHSPATNPGHFTPAQLAEIKKVTMSRLICDNSDHIELFSQAPNAFIKPDIPGNELIDCQSHLIQIVDFSPWKEF